MISSQHKPALTLQQATRNRHITQILQRLRFEAPLSRAELSRKTGLAKSSLTVIIEEMLNLGLIVESAPAADGVGKPSIGLALNPQGGAAIGVEINPGYVSVMLTNFIAEVLWEEIKPVEPGSDQRYYLAPAESFITAAMEYARTQKIPILGIGVALPGSVDLQSGSVYSSTSLDWYQVPIRAPWQVKFELPVIVDTVANMGALGEHLFGCAQDVDTFLYINQSFGFRRNIGLAMMLDGKLWRGVNGFAGRAGHMVIDPHGPLCDCGQRGCWRVMTSDEMEIRQVKEVLKNGRSSILSEYRLNDYAALNSDLIHQAVICGDAVACEVFESMYIIAEQVISNLVNIFDPGVVVTGFSYTDMNKPEVNEILKGLGAFFNEMAQKHKVTIPAERRLSQLGSQSALLGAVSMVLNDFMENPKSAGVQQEGILLVDGLIKTIEEPRSM